MTTTHQAPTETAFGYAISLTQQLAKLAKLPAADLTKLLLDLAGMSASQTSKYIDVTQKIVGQLKMAQKSAPGFTPATLAYVPPAGQYLIDGEHYTLKVSKAHGGTLVYEKYSGYVGALAAPKCASIAAALDSAEKAQAACIAYAKATGKCGVCNTKLTDPKSIAAGIGPVCAKKYA